MAKEINILFIMNQCSICFEELSNLIKKLECNHNFHDNCIDTWTLYKNNCPLCRNIIKNVKINYDFNIIDLHALFMMFYLLLLLCKNDSVSNRDLCEVDDNQNKNNNILYLE